MNFKFNHNNLNVRDLEKSIQFYKDALGLTVVREKDAADGSFKLVYLGDGSSVHQLELTWLRDRTEPYNLGECKFHLAFVTDEIHLAFTVDDMDAALAHHKEMNCVCFENESMGIYFIEDPDGYWLEIVPEK